MSDSPASKRRRVSFDDDGRNAPTRSKTTSSAAAIFRLPVATVLQYCFSFVGNGQYRYVAGTSRQFRDIYSKEHEKKTMFSQTQHNPWHYVPSFVLTKRQQEQTLRRTRILVLLQMPFTVEAAHAGNISVLEWLRQMGVDFTNHTAFMVAAGVGKTRVLRWAESKSLDWSFPGLYIEAGKEGHVETFEWIHSTGKVAFIPMEAGSVAAEGGHTAILQWMKDNDVLHTADHLYFHIGRGGHTDVLEWLEMNGFELRANDVDRVLGGACSGGHKTILLTWAREHGIEWKELLCTFAAAHNNLSVLQWLRESGCPWSGGVAKVAEVFGHHHVVNWARENGCPVDDE